MLVVDDGVIILVAPVDVDCNNKMTWPLRCWYIPPRDRHCSSCHCVLGNVKNTRCTTIFYFGTWINHHPCPL